MEWISVKDELPEDYIDVLVYDGRDYYIGHVGNDKLWYITKNSLIPTYYEIEDVTHWKYLPTPPEDK